MCKSFCWLSAIISTVAHCQYAGSMETSKSDRAPQLADKYVLRMPDGMRDRLAELAKANNRSMNAEIVLILQQAIEARVHPPAPSLDTHALAMEIADLVAARLKG